MYNEKKIAICSPASQEFTAKMYFNEKYEEKRTTAYSLTFICDFEFPVD